MSRYLVTEHRTIDVASRVLFNIVADPAMHPVIDGSGTVLALLNAPDRLSLGAEFGMNMRLGVRYQVQNRVTEFVEDRRIAWRHFNGHVWRYVFEPTETGTRVTEQWDATAVWNRELLVLLGFARRNRRGIEATLDRLARFAGAADE
jgi:polyketide cyclase/dehydrase/lipid transport protein